MSYKDVRGHIEALKGELEQIPQETGSLEERLAQAGEGIERFTPEAAQELIALLRREAEAFEAGHPRITALINQVATALSSLGI